MDLGLTLQESRVYCALVENGPSKVESLAKNSQTSRSDVYRTVKKLSNLGLIECKLTKPHTYKAMPPKVVINTLLDESRKNFERKKTLSLNLLKEFEEDPKNEDKNQEDVIFISSKQAVIENVKKTLKKTNNTIDILTTSTRLTQSCYNFSQFLQEAWTRNVKCRVLVSKPNENHIELFQKVYSEPCCEIRFLNSKPDVILMVYDKKMVSIFTDLCPQIKESTCLWSNNHSIVSLANQHFEHNWNCNCNKNNLTK